MFIINHESYSLPVLAEILDPPIPAQSSIESRASMKIKSKLHQLIPTNLSHQTKEFFSNSTLHGVRYIAEKGRPFGEKFMWFCCVAVGAVAAFVIIGSLWEKFQTNPTITGIVGVWKFHYATLFIARLSSSPLMDDLGLDTDFHNQELEFPTVSICPVEPFDAEKVNETVYRTLVDYEDAFGELVPLVELLPALSYENMDEAYEIFRGITVKLDSVHKTSLRKLAFKVAMKCEDLLYKCFFRGEEIPCCEYFQPIYTERGFCYSFNARYISPEEDE